MPSLRQQNSPDFKAGRRVGEVLGLAVLAAFTGLLIAIAVLAIIGAFRAP